MDETLREPLAPGKRVGRYRLKRLLARGGMGEVYLACQEGPGGFERTVVVKRILPELGRDPAFVEMFLSEARLASLLSHPNVVQLFELGESGGSVFMAMEYVRGHSLRAVEQRARQAGGGTLKVSTAMWICALALDGLHHAHEMTDEAGRKLSVVHRDVSPDNILVGFNGSVKMADFGIAKAATVSTPVTRVGMLKGKWSYMSPERVTGGAVDHRLDVYSMGAVLYELVVGRPAIPRGDEAMMAMRIVHHAVQPPRELDPDIPPELEQIILRALAKDPEARFVSAREMSVALKRFVREEGGEAPVEPAETISEMMGALFNPSPSELERERPSPDTAAIFSPGLSVTRDENPAPTVLEGPRPAAAHGLWVPLRRLRLPLLALGLAGTGGWAVLHTRSELPRAALMARTPQPPAPAPARDRASAVAGAAVAPRPPSQPEATQPRVVRPEGDGRLVLRVYPWAEIFFHGKSLGMTPLPAQKLPSGRQTLTFKNSELGVTRRLQVTVPRDGERVIRVDLTKED